MKFKKVVLAGLVALSPVALDGIKSNQTPLVFEESYKIKRLEVHEYDKALNLFNITSRGLSLMLRFKERVEAINKPSLREDGVVVGKFKSGTIEPEIYVGKHVAYLRVFKMGLEMGMMDVTGDKTLKKLMDGIWDRLRSSWEWKVKGDLLMLKGDNFLVVFPKIDKKAAIFSLYNKRTGGLHMLVLEYPKIEYEKYRLKGPVLEIINKGETVLKMQRNNYGLTGIDLIFPEMVIGVLF